jgi:FkbM family methyltransferase
MEMSTNGVVALPSSSAALLVNHLTLNLSPFDQRHYQKLIRAREETIRNVLRRVSPFLGLHTALDAGAGVGFFSQTLIDCGLNVCGFDGRAENVAEARRRFPHIPFEQADLQDRRILELGKFDLVLCFGLLYHLENPLLAIRNLRTLSEKCLLLESMCVPDDKPSMLLREEPRAVDQSLTDIAYYPSEDSLIKMLYRAGFPLVYRLTPLPDHDDFRDTREHRRKRTVLFASAVPIDLFGFRLCIEDRETRDPWTKQNSVATFPGRVSRFLAQPGRKKYFSLANHVRRIVPALPIPWRLPFGAWWLAQDGELDQKLVDEEFEKKELHFVETLLRPGMTVLDIGAHHGLYTLLASKCVGHKGSVIAFEASPRECRRLGKHVRINGCDNVRIKPCAAGSEHGWSDFFIVDGSCDWGNSLRMPVVTEPVYKVRVEVRAIDDVLFELGISKIDFIKLDVEGAELAVLEGATRLLRGPSRPAILAEVQDLRTEPFGYQARAVVQFLARMDYRWFSIAPDSSLQPISSELNSYDANLVALPGERAREFRSLVDRKRMFFPLYQPRATFGRERGKEILKSMVRVRQGCSKS